MAPSSIRCTTLCVRKTICQALFYQTAMSSGDMYVVLCHSVSIDTNTSQTKQRLYDWRRNFFKNARSLVQKDIQARFAPNVRRKREIIQVLAQHRGDIALYAKEQLATGGWIYERPAKNPKVCLLARYIMTIMTQHCIGIDRAFHHEIYTPARCCPSCSNRRFFAHGAHSSCGGPCPCCYCSKSSFALLSHLHQELIG